MSCFSKNLFKRFTISLIPRSEQEGKTSFASRLQTICTALSSFTDSGRMSQNSMAFVFVLLLASVAVIITLA
jgi:hypothetical protein